MCHPSDTDHMPVDTTWGILSLSGMFISILQCLIIMLLIRLLLQFEIVHKSLWRSGVFWKVFSANQSLRRECRQSWSHSTPSIGTMTDQNQQQLPIVTMLKFINVSSSPYIWVSLIVLYFTLTICLTFVYRWMLQTEGPLSNNRQPKRKRWMVNSLRRRCHPTRQQKGSSWKSKAIFPRSPKLSQSPSWDQRLRARRRLPKPSMERERVS